MTHEESFDKLVEAANQKANPMEDLARPFHKFERNGLSLTVEFSKSNEMKRDAFDWCFRLLESNMKPFYDNSSWGWNVAKKRREMKEETAEFLLIKNQNGEGLRLVAFVHFRFCLDEDLPVIYCYEIQIDENHRGKGLGKFLIQILELLAFKNKMGKVMATVFTHNNGSERFFRSLGFTNDDSCPTRNASAEDVLMGSYDYIILSKSVKKKS